MKKMVLNVVIAFSFSIIISMFISIPCKATVTNAWGEIVDENGYPIIGGDEDVYSNNDNHKSNNLVTMFKDFTISTETRDSWNNIKSNPVVGQSMKKTGVGSYVDGILGVLDFLEESIDDGKTPMEALYGWGTSALSSLNPFKSIMDRTVKKGQELIDSGKTVSSSTNDLISKTNQNQVMAEDFFRENPQKAEELQQGVPVLAAVLQMVSGGAGDNSYISDKASARNSANSSISAEGNGGSIDHSDGITEDQLIEELMYLDSLGLTDEEFDRQLEAWVNEHGGY